jgi:PQQ enzyme repeat
MSLSVGLMRSTLVLSFAFAMAATGWPSAAIPGQELVLTYHAHPDRSGNFVVPPLTWERARSLHLDEHFDARLSGHIYAQPLYWRSPGANSGVLLVATEDDVIYALDARTGKEIWIRSLGKAVPVSSLNCGNINPLGITGTPVIDPSSESIYLDAVIGGLSGPRHLIFGLSLRDGSLLPGWPVDVADALKEKGETFNPRDQNERGALTIIDGTLLCPLGAILGIAASTMAES